MPGNTASQWIPQSSVTVENDEADMPLDGHPEFNVFHQDMKKIKKRSASWLAKSARRGLRGYPIATVALYGPTADLATKIARLYHPRRTQLARPARTLVLRRYRCSPRPGCRRADPGLPAPASGSLRGRDRQCHRLPHEEGVDYPEGQSCPHCPYWAGRDRFTHERIH
jgi:hypothetical protein